MEELTRLKYDSIEDLCFIFERAISKLADNVVVFYIIHSRAVAVSGRQRVNSVMS